MTIGTLALDARFCYIWFSEEITEAYSSLLKCNNPPTLYQLRNGTYQ